MKVKRVKLQGFRDSAERPESSANVALGYMGSCGFGIRVQVLGFRV